MKKLLFLVFLTLTSYSLLAQTVTGRVTSESDGSGLAGVTIMVKGTTTGTSSDANGNYRITVNSSQTLAFSFLGFKSAEELVGNRSVINVAMEEDNTQLSEVTVTAMGIERSARSLGYASQGVTAEKLNSNKQVNMVSSLQGKVAGVQITTTGGAPGQGAKIVIRGINSLDPGRDNSPLFVIDGTIMDNSTSTQGSSGSLRSVSNRAVDVNPDDIESINILRGGAATALYGLRGANGVVLITTKTGQSGSVNVDYNISYGIDEVDKFPKFQKVYTQGWNGVYDTDSFWPAYGPTVEEARAIDPSHPAELYDTFRQAYQKGHQLKNNLSFSGGSQKVNYMTSFSHVTQEGVMPFTNFKNIQGRINTNIKPSNKFSINTNMSINNSGGDRGNSSRFNEQITYWAPRYDVADYKKPDGTQFIPYPSLSDNPLYIAETNRFFDNVLRFIGSTRLNYNPLSWLGFNYTVGIDTYRDERQNTAPGFQGLKDEMVIDDNGGPGKSGTGFIYVYNNRQLSVNSTFLVNLNKQFTDNFGGTLTLGNEFFKRNIYRTSVEGWKLTIWDWFDLANANELAAGTYKSDYRLMGNFADLTLNLNNYLYLNLTGRNDITSSLLAPYNSFFYPSASLSYILSDNVKLPASIDYAKLRLSYAKVGKDANQYATSMGFASYTGLPTGYTGFTRSALLGNPTLRPEFTDTYEIGAEVNLFNGRLRLDGNFYHSISKDQILSIPISATTGYVTASTNIGSMRNKGIELSIGTAPVRNSNFSWNSDINFSANRNKILSLYGSESDVISVYSESGYIGSTVSLKLIPGLPYGTLYGRPVKRYYTPEEISQGLDKSLVIDKSRPIVIGANGFPVLEATSVQKQMGNILPKFILGWYNSFKYKNIDFNFLFDGQFGHQAYSQLGNFMTAFGLTEKTLDRRDHVVFDGVLADGTKNTKEVWLGQGVDPQTGIDYGNGYYRNYYRAYSEPFVEDISWLKLRSASVNYNLPKEWFAGGQFIKNASIGFTGNNLLIFTKFNGFDPENVTTNSGSNVAGFAGFTYPGIRTYMFNLNVKF